MNEERKNRRGEWIGTGSGDTYLISHKESGDVIIFSKCINHSSKGGILTIRPLWIRFLDLSIECIQVQKYVDPII
jgi:hypothetical protein